VSGTTEKDHDSVTVRASTDDEDAENGWGRAMSEKTVAFVQAMTTRFPALRPLLDEHVSDNFGEVLPHVFFGDVTSFVVALATQADGHGSPQRRELADLLRHLEDSFVAGDGELQELISVSFLEALPRTGEPGAEVRGMVGTNLRAALDVIG